MATAAQRNAVNFNRMFSPDFLSVRKDVTPAMLACAKGDFSSVKAILEDEPFQVHNKNKDGNTLLLIAVANGHEQLSNYLLDLKSDVQQRNVSHMDALDYATMEGVKNKISKVVLSHCDFLVPEIIPGQHQSLCNLVLQDLRTQGIPTARSSILGKLPDFSDIFSKETEYRIEWQRALLWVCETVKKGVLLLSEDITYLERDALLAGLLEVPIPRRWVNVQDYGPIKFSLALKKVYSAQMEKRMIDASTEGDATAVQGLLKARAHANIEDPYGLTVLMKACHGGNSQVIKCLLQAQAKVNATSKDGYSALFLAAVRNHEKSVNLLLRAKADPKAKSYRGNTVIDFVKHNGNNHMMHLINDFGIKKEDLKPEGVLDAIR